MPEAPEITFTPAPTSEPDSSGPETPPSSRTRIRDRIPRVRVVRPDHADAGDHGSEGRVRRIVNRLPRVRVVRPDAPGGGDTPPAEPPPPPVDETPPAGVDPINVHADEHGVYTANLVNRTADLEKRIREEARRQVKEEQQKGSAWNIKNWPRKLRFKFGEDYYEQRGIKMLREEAIKHNNVFLDMDIIRGSVRDARRDLASHAEAGKAKVEQVRLGKQTGEGETSFQQTREADEKLRDLLVTAVFKPIVDGTITNEVQLQKRLAAFVESHHNHADRNVRDQINGMFGTKATDFGERAKVFASDFLEVGLALKGDIDAHRFAVDQMNEKIKINLANTEWAASSAIKYGVADRAATWLKQTRVGPWINEATVGAAASILVFSLPRISRRALAAVGAGTGAGFIMGYFERNRNLKKDIGTHRAETEYGLNMDTTARSGVRGRLIDAADTRKKLERFRFEQLASVSQILSSDADRNGLGDPRSLNTLLSLDAGDTAIRTALASRIAEIQARLRFSADDRTGIIQFEDKTKTEQGRLALVKGIVDGKQKLIDALTTGTTTRAQAEAEVEDLLKKARTKWERQFTVDRNHQEREFATYRFRSSLTMGAFGGATALASGLLTQQGFAEVRAHLSDRAVKPTLLEQAGLERIHSHSTGHEVAIQHLREALNQHNPNEAIAQFGQLGIQAHTLENGTIVLDAVNGTKLHEAVPPQLTYNPDTQTFLVRGKVPDAVTDILRDNKFDVSSPRYAAVALNEHPGVKLDTIPGTDLKIDIPAGTELRKGPHGYELWTKEINRTVVPVSAEPMKVADGLTFDSTGHMTHGNILRSDIIQLGESKKGPGVSMEVQPWLEQHRAHVDGWEWYGNDTAGSDRNELKLYDYRAGKTGVKFDMMDMDQSWQHGNYPNPVDVPDVIKQGKAAFTFWDPKHPNTPLVVRAEHGQLTLDKTSKGMVELWKDGKWVKVKNAEVANVVLGDLGDFQSGSDSSRHTGILNYNISASGVFEQPDGKTKIGSFATATGSGHAPAVIHGSASEVTTFNPVVETRIAFPEDWEPMPITVPLTPRRHLGEAVQRADAIPVGRYGRYGRYGSYGRYGPETSSRRRRGEREDSLLVTHEPGLVPPESPRRDEEDSTVDTDLGLMDWDTDFPARRSETLTRDPEAKLDEKAEIESYINKWAPEYKEELERMDSEVGEPMSDERRAVITIPAYAEGRIIRQTLSQFLDQKDREGNAINPELFEIIVFDNHPPTADKDNTEEEIRAFQDEHPELKVVYAHKEWGPDDPMTVGNARKYATDLALLRDSQRTAPAGDLIIINGDADVDSVKDTYIYNYIQEFDKNEHLDAIGGRWNLPDWVLTNPNVKAAQRFWYSLDFLIQRDAVGNPADRGRRAVPLIGRNSALRASTLAAVGGFNPEAKLAEDLEVGWMISVARGWDPSRFEYLNTVELVTTPRRFLASMAQDTPLLLMYDNFHEDTSVRQMDDRELFSRISSAFDPAKLERELDTFWQAGIQGQYAYLGDRYELLFQRAADMLGVKYEIRDGHVKLLDTTSYEASFDFDKRRHVTELKSAATVYDEINQRLDGLNRTEQGFLFKPELLAEFIRTNPSLLGEGVNTVNNVELHIDSNTISLKGEIVYNGKRVEVKDAKFEITPDNQLKLVGRINFVFMDPSGLAGADPSLRERLRVVRDRGAARVQRWLLASRLEDLNDRLRVKLNDNITDTEWGVSGFRIDDHELVMLTEHGPDARNIALPAAAAPLVSDPHRRTSDDIIDFVRGRGRSTNADDDTAPIPPVPGVNLDQVTQNLPAVHPERQDNERTAEIPELRIHPGQVVSHAQRGNLIFEGIEHHAGGDYAILWDPTGQRIATELDYLNSQLDQAGGDWHTVVSPTTNLDLDNPADGLAEIRQQLTTSHELDHVFMLSPDDLAQFLTAQDRQPRNAHQDGIFGVNMDVEDMQLRVEGDRIILGGNFHFFDSERRNIRVRDAAFRIVDGKLELVSPPDIEYLNPPAAAHMPTGAIMVAPERLQHFGENVTNFLSARLGGWQPAASNGFEHGWQMDPAGFQIEGGRIGLKFNKHARPERQNPAQAAA